MQQPRIDPPDQLRRELAAFKRQQVPFEDAWPAALKKVRWPHDRQSRREWRSATMDIEQVWADCYRDEGTPIDLEHLVGLIGEEDHDFDLDD